MENPGKARLIVSRGCISSDMQPNRDNSELQQDIPLIRLKAICRAIREGRYVFPLIPPSLSLPRFLRAPGNESMPPSLSPHLRVPSSFQEAPGLTHRYPISLPRRDDESTLLSPTTPRGTQRMIYESSWKVTKRPQPAPTERQTKRREWGGGGRYRRESAERGKRSNAACVSVISVRQISGKCVHQLRGTAAVMHACRHTHKHTRCSGVFFSADRQCFGIGVSGHRLMVYIL